MERFDSRNSSGSEIPKGLFVLVGLIALVIVFYLFMCVTIGSGKRGVITQMGAVSDQILGEGFHIISPLQSVHKMDVQVQKIDVKAEASSKDLQVVHTKITLNYHPDPAKVNKIYQQLSVDYDDRVIKPAIQEYLKKSTAMYTAEELVSKREFVKEAFRQSLTISLASSNIIVDNVFITNFEFSKTFNDAIEAKVTAEQEALQEKNNLQKVKYVADQRVAAAEAEAKAIAIQAKAITQQGGRDYVQLKAIEKWDGHLPAQMIPGSAVPFVNLTK